MSDIYSDMCQVYREAGISLRNACERAYALTADNDDSYQAYAELLRVEMFMQQKYQALRHGELIMSNEVKTAAYDQQMNRISSKSRVSDEQVRFLELVIDEIRDEKYLYEGTKAYLDKQMRLYRRVFDISENNSISGK